MLSLLLCVIGSPDLRVAYTARFYSPPSSKRTTYQQVYLCDLTGKQRKQITRANVDCGAVRWTGANTIAWVIQRGNKSELWGTSIGGKPKRIRSADYIYAMQSVDKDIGGGAVYNIAGANYTLIGSTLKVLPAMGKPDPKMITFSGPNNAKAVIDLSKGTTNWTLTISQGSASKVETHEDDNVRFVRAYPFRQGDQPTFITFAGNSTTGGCWSVERLDWETANIENVAFGTDIDFSPKRDIWAGVSPRDLKPYGKVQVWSSEAFIGSQSTGKKTQLGFGLVYFTSISLR